MLAILLCLLVCVLAISGIITFTRLKQAEKTYASSDAFSEGTHLSSVYVQGNLTLNIIVLIFASIILGNLILVLMKVKQ